MDQSSVSSSGTMSSSAYERCALASTGMSLRDLASQLVTPPLSEEAQGLVTWMHETGLQVFFRDDDTLPFRCDRVPNPPQMLVAYGDVSLLDRLSFFCTIVGPRRNSAYGERIVTELLRACRGRDVITVSGMAPGIDTICHRQSLREGLPTIAILGGGMCHYLRSRHRAMMDSIVEHGGLVLSERGLKQEPTHYTFPQRNRIVAGLGDAVIVPEAAEKSGTLITLDVACQHGVPVFVAPADMFAETSRGANAALNRQGVSALTDCEQRVMEHTSPVNGSDTAVDANEVDRSSLDEDQQVIVRLIQTQRTVTQKDVLTALDGRSDDMSVALSMLEFDEFIVQDGPGVWRSLV